MFNGALEIQMISCQALTSIERAEMTALCSKAFKRDYAPYLKLFPGSIHLLGRYKSQLVSHVLWVTRWLQVETHPIMRTAFIEGMATEASYRNRGFASILMNRAVEEIKNFDIAALATGSPGFYIRLGWQQWRGPLFIRKNERLVPTPGEHGVMVLSLPKTPPLDINAQLSAEWREGDLW